ncbi:hypothetical protein SEA_ENGINEER_171 [Gordonia Phage Engineer]|nr:hypothetical protein SEA_ENGINEER_171 [Gordonia Phage Engineer]
MLSHWDVDPNYPLEDWKREVEADETRLGYHDWIEQQQEMEA